MASCTSSALAQFYLRGIFLFLFFSFLNFTSHFLPTVQQLQPTKPCEHSMSSTPAAVDKAAHINTTFASTSPTRQGKKTNSLMDIP